MPLARWRWPLMFGVVAMTAFAVYRPDRALRVATGVVAHAVCGKTFTSGLDADTAMAETLARPGLRWLSWGLGHLVESQAGSHSVTGSFGRLIHVTALYRPGLGCVLVNGVRPVKFDRAPIEAAKTTGTTLLPTFAGDAVVEPSSKALAAALAHAFEEQVQAPLRRTKAIVMVRNGAIIAERYAPGIGPDTPLAGHSLSKSVTNALLGVLAHDGLLSLTDPASIAEWQSEGDPRRAITIEHLLRMTTGLAADETNSGFDASSRILYLEPDLASAAARLPAQTKPETRWHYSSPSTMLLARIITTKAGGTAERVLAFAHERLFAPLGMRSIIVETDASGTIVTNSHMSASARDWARLGLLYLNDGRLGATRLLPEGWVAASASASASLGTTYGAGFWTARSDHGWARQLRAGGLPEDAFFASGDLGQRIVIIPSKRLVIVRLGDATDPTGDIGGLLRLVRETISAFDGG